LVALPAVAGVNQKRKFMTRQDPIYGNNTVLGGSRCGRRELWVATAFWIALTLGKNTLKIVKPLK